MAKTERAWKVAPHGPIEKLEDNLWAVAGPMPMGMTRRMSIVRRSDGSLVFYQAVPVSDAALAQIRAWGRPAALVIPHAQHGVYAAAFAEKLGVALYGAQSQWDALRARWRMAGTLDALPPDPAVRFEEVAGTRAHEAVGIVTSGGGRVSLLFADAYQATPSAGLPLPARVLGFGGGPRVVPLFRAFFMSDRRALQTHLERLAALPGLTHLVPCHGAITSSDAAGTLRRVAAALGRHG